MAATITGSKRTFLESQVRVLTAQLEVPASESWQLRRGGSRRGAQSTAPAAAEEAEDLSENVVQDVLRNVNDRLRRHNAAAFPPAALAHVAAQINALREHDASEAFPGRGGATAAEHGRLNPELLEPGVRLDGAIDRGAVLTADSVIAALPKTWPGDDGADDSETPRATAKRRLPAAGRVSTLETFAGGQDYGVRLRRLRELQDQRARARRRLAQLRLLHRLTEPLRNPAANVQPNLVGRDGEVGKELERMRVLLQRAANKVGTL